jgi:hypothetical protein
MEPITLSIILASLAFGVAVTFWDNVRTWVEDHLLPLIHNRFPEYEQLAREAYAKLDGVAVKIRNLARRAWKKLKEIILKQVVILERNTSSSWVRKIRTWLVKSLDQPNTATVTETTEDIAWEDMPDDIRAEITRRGLHRVEENYRERRDQEFEMLELKVG